jgi:hypothetical protein
MSNCQIIHSWVCVPTLWGLQIYLWDCTSPVLPVTLVILVPSLCPSSVVVLALSEGRFVPDERVHVLDRFVLDERWSFLIICSPFSSSSFSEYFMSKFMWYLWIFLCPSRAIDHMTNDILSTSVWLNLTARGDITEYLGHICIVADPLPFFFTKRGLIICVWNCRFEIILLCFESGWPCSNLLCFLDALDDMYELVEIYQHEDQSLTSFCKVTLNLLTYSKVCICATLAVFIHDKLCLLWLYILNSWTFKNWVRVLFSLLQYIVWSSSFSAISMIVLNCIHISFLQTWCILHYAAEKIIFLFVFGIELYTVLGRCQLPLFRTLILLPAFTYSSYSLFCNSWREYTTYSVAAHVLWWCLVPISHIFSFSDSCWGGAAVDCMPPSVAPPGGNEEPQNHGCTRIKKRRKSQQSSYGRSRGGRKEV